MPTALNNTAPVNEAGVLKLKVKVPLEKELKPVLSTVEMEVVAALRIIELPVKFDGVNAIT